MTDRSAVSEFLETVTEPKPRFTPEQQRVLDAFFAGEIEVEEEIVFDKLPIGFGAEEFE